MKRRWMLAMLALVAVGAIVVPAIALDSKPAQQSPSQIATASRVKAHHALGQARKAKKLANRALKLAQQPTPAAATLPATSFAQVDGASSTGSTSAYVSLGGPSVTVTVPKAANANGAGLIQVAAQARVGDDAGAVALFEDGSPMPGQSDVCDTVVGTPGPALFASFDGLGGIWGTPAVIIFPGGCASSGPAGPVLFATTPGTHTYELRYGYCGCSGTEATFSERKLWVTPLG